MGDFPRRSFEVSFSCQLMHKKRKSVAVDRCGRSCTNNEDSSFPPHWISKQDHHWVIVASTAKTHTDEELRVDVLHLS